MRSLPQAAFCATPSGTRWKRSASASRRRRRALAGLWFVLLASLALAPLAIHQMSLGHAEWIGERSLGHRLWESAVTFVAGETGDIVARPETVLPAVVPLLAVLAGLVLLAAPVDRRDRRAP